MRKTPADYTTQAAHFTHAEQFRSPSAALLWGQTHAHPSSQGCCLPPAFTAAVLHAAPALQTGRTPCLPNRRHPTTARGSLRTERRTTPRPLRAFRTIPTTSGRPPPRRPAAGAAAGRGPPREGGRRARGPAPGRPRLTLDGDDMLADLVLQHGLLDALQQLVDGVDVGVHRLEALDLGADGCRVGQLLLVVHGPPFPSFPSPPRGQTSAPAAPAASRPAEGLRGRPRRRAPPPVTSRRRRGRASRQPPAPWKAAAGWGASRLRAGRLLLLQLPSQPRLRARHRITAARSGSGTVPPTPPPALAPPPPTSFSSACLTLTQAAPLALPHRAARCLPRPARPACAPRATLGNVGGNAEAAAAIFASPSSRWAGLVSHPPASRSHRPDKRKLAQRAR